MPPHPNRRTTIVDRLREHALLLPPDDPAIDLLLDAASSLELVWEGCSEAMRRLRYPERATPPAALEMMAISTDLGRKYIDSHRVELE